MKTMLTSESSKRSTLLQAIYNVVQNGLWEMRLRYLCFKWLFSWLQYKILKIEAEACFYNLKCERLQEDDRAKALHHSVQYTIPSISTRQLLSWTEIISTRNVRQNLCS